MARPEDSRVKIPALVHFTRLGYQYMSIKDMVRGVDYDPDTNIFYLSISTISSSPHFITEHILTNTSKETYSLLLIL